MKIRIDEIKNKLSKGDLETSVEMLLEDTRNTDHEIEGVLVASKYHKLKKEKNLGVIESNLEQLRFNKIVIDIIELLNEIVTKFLHDEIIYEEVLFFETPRETLIHQDDRKYAQSFKSARTRHIGWELHMASPIFKADINYLLKWYIRRPNGSVSPKFSTELIFEKGWSNPWKAGSWGGINFGNLEIGNYTICFEIRNKKVLEGNFEIT